MNNKTIRMYQSKNIYLDCKKKKWGKQKLQQIKIFKESRSYFNKVQMYTSVLHTTVNAKIQELCKKTFSALYWCYKNIKKHQSHTFDFTTGTTVIFLWQAEYLRLSEMAATACLLNIFPNMFMHYTHNKVVVFSALFHRFSPRTNTEKSHYLGRHWFPV